MKDKPKGYPVKSASPDPRFNLPSLHEKQKLIYDSIVHEGQKFSVVVAGRRFGKSRVALAIVLDMVMNRGMRVWWVSPSYKVSDVQWRQTKRMLKNRYTNKSEIDRRLEFFYPDKQGKMMYGELTFKSGDRPDNMRGEGLDFIVIDEAAFTDPVVWKVLRPALTDRGGGALFISTPNGLNWFYTLYSRAQDELRTDWRAWHFTSYDNPFIDKAEIDSAKEDLSEEAFEEEHLAVFKEDSGRVFRKAAKLSILQMREGREHGHIYGMGIDLGRKHDATVISVIDLTSGRQVWVDRFTQVNYGIQQERVMAAVRRWKPVKIFIEENSAGGYFIEELQKKGVKNIEPFYTSGSNKVSLIDALVSAMEREQLFLLNDETPMGRQQLNELRAYQTKRTKSGNSWTYSAPSGFFDDMVMALALAWQTMISKPSEVQLSENLFYPRPKPPAATTKNSFLSKAKAKSRALKAALIERENASNF